MICELCDRGDCGFEGLSDAGLYLGVLLFIGGISEMGRL